jgi:crotonobetainyl-CoA:carnitine CoA-transferase CaiB-like acyl-CoA transferase
MAQVLVGTRVLDLTRLLPGPFCTQMLADLGAEVIKVEAPGEGDYSRTLYTAIRGYGSTFLMLNRNKKSITLNLKKQAGAEVFRRLAGSADVVIESFRPGVVDRLGIGYKSLKRDNRKLIYCSLTGFGQDGPYAQRAGHDINYLSYSGIGSLTGPKGGPPVPLGIQAADIAGGALTAAFAVMTALYHREQTGRGQFIDVAMLDGLLAVGQTLVGEFLSTGRAPGPGTMRLTGGYPVYGIYETKDGKHFAIGALEAKFWEIFCKKAGRPDLILLHQAARDKESEKLEKELKALFKQKTRAEWSALLEGEDACASPVLTMDEVMKDPHLKHRGMFVTGPHPEEGEVTQVAFPVKFSDITPEPPGPAPQLGQHTEEILLSVGYTKKEIEGFKKDGVT